jgi:hypothetical protein
MCKAIERTAVVGHSKVVEVAAHLTPNRLAEVGEAADVAFLVFSTRRLAKILPGQSLLP